MPALSTCTAYCTAKRHPWTEQRSGKKTAFEIAPGMQHILRAHAGRRDGRFGLRGMDGAVRRNGAIAVVQNLVAHEEGEFVLQPLFLLQQSLVDEHGRGCFELRSHQRPARLAGLAVEPSHIQPVPFADCHDGIQVERHLAFAAFFGRTLDIGKVVVPGFLPDANQ
jgi:arylamine N-acetyltransferase